MAVKRSRSKSTKRKPFWERLLEWILSTLKRLIIPALVIWLVGWLWLGGVFASGANMAWESFVGWSASQGLIVSDVVIKGRDKTSMNDLGRAINVQLNDPLLSVDVQEIQKNIINLSWVKNVVVARQYNGVVSVDIHERIPFVVWDRDGRAPVVVDIDGDIIPMVEASHFKKLLIVHGVAAPHHASDLMRMVIAEPDVAKYIKGAEWVGDRRWDLITAMKTRIHMPEKDLGFALSRLAKAEENNKILSRPLLSIDLRGEDRIIIESESGQSQDVMSLSSNAKTNLI
jgi:cell division protein FtsQ